MARVKVRARVRVNLEGRAPMVGELGRARTELLRVGCDLKRDGGQIRQVRAEDAQRAYLVRAQG